MYMYISVEHILNLSNTSKNKSKPKKELLVCDTMEQSTCT